jgi:hypothetical protein
MVIIVLVMRGICDLKPTQPLCFCIIEVDIRLLLMRIKSTLFVTFLAGPNYKC